MSERYSKLFSLPGNLYAEGAPVIVSAGNLLKDNQTGKVLAQLKIKNIAAMPIKAATVLIHPQDAAGKPMTGDTQQKYLDLTAGTGDEFGQKTAVFLPDASARGFSVEVTQAVFSDNSTWEGTDAAWEPLPAPESLSGKLGDTELLKQFQLHFGGKCETVPQKYKDIWLCSCGAWNREDMCYCCSKDKNAQLDLDYDALRAEKDVRLAKEKAECEAKRAADKAAAEAKAKKTKKTLAIVIPVAVILLGVLLTLKVFIPNSKYKKAEALFQSGQYEEAIAAFEALDGYKNSEEQIAAVEAAVQEQANLAEEARLEAENAAAYEHAESLVRSGKLYEAAVAFYQIKDYQDSWDRCFQIWSTITASVPVSGGQAFSVGLLNNGRVIATGDNIYGQCDVNNWDGIVELSAGYFHTVGLKSDGSVIAIGNNDYGQCDVQGWADIISISAGDVQTVGITKDGQVLAVGYNNYGQCNVSDWEHVIMVSAEQNHTVGLRADGTVCATGDNKYGQCDVSKWTDIVAVAAGGGHTVALKRDGTVIAIGSNKYGQCDVNEWHDVVAIAAGAAHTIGLRADGTVCAVGYNESGQCNTSDWKGIISISAGKLHTIVIDNNGSVIATGYNEYGQCDVSDWSNLKLPG